MAGKKFKVGDIVKSLSTGAIGRIDEVVAAPVGMSIVVDWLKKSISPAVGLPGTFQYPGDLKILKRSKK